MPRARAAARGVMLEGTANSRAVGWHRPPIDRMANLNIEPGDSTFDQMVACVERGVLMRTKRVLSRSHTSQTKSISRIAVGLWGKANMLLGC